MIGDRAEAPRGHFRLWVCRSGIWRLEVDEPNLIVNNSKQVHAQLLGGDVTNQSVTKIGFGTGTNVPDVGNSALTNAVIKALDSHNYPASNEVNFNFSLGTSEANGTSISEFGLLTAANTLYARKVRGVPIAKTNTISFSGTWTITF